jgi:hypothetical protein
MNTISITILSILLFMGLQKAQAQAHRIENKTEIEPKVKVSEHTGPAPVKEPEVKKETPPEEITPVAEPKASVSIKEPEAKTEAQSTGNSSVPITTEKKEAPVTSTVHPRRNIATLPAQKMTLPSAAKPVVIEAEKK